MDKYYDDRVLHTVSLRKRRKKIEVRVDDMEVQEEKLSTGSGSITSDFMYIGGAPPDIDLSGLAASARSFVGCITGLIINGVLVGFEQLQAFDKAAVGRCEFEGPLSPVSWMWMIKLLSPILLYYFSGLLVYLLHWLPLFFLFT